MENNIFADNGARRQADNPSFRLSGEITARKFDGRRYVTEITTSQSFDTADLPDSVVRIGGQWSVIKSSGPSSLVVWGKITDESARADVLDHYVAQQ
jgi:hypothetical protein